MNIFHLNNRNRQKPKNFNATTSYSVKLRIFPPFLSMSNSSSKLKLHFREILASQHLDIPTT